MKEIKTYQDAVAYITHIVDLLNEEFWNNELPKCQITIAPRAGTYAHYSTQEIWKDSETGYHEINLAAAHLSRDIVLVCTSLQHELTHHYNWIHGFKDTSGSGNYYHNSRFRDTAEAHGLTVQKHDKYGWTITSPAKEMYDFVEKYDLTSMLINRYEGSFAFGGGSSAGNGNGLTGAELTPPRKKSTHKLVCPCGCIVRASKLGLQIRCLDCGEDFAYVD